MILDSFSKYHVKSICHWFHWELYATTKFYYRFNLLNLMVKVQFQFYECSRIGKTIIIDLYLVPYSLSIGCFGLVLSPYAYHYSKVKHDG